MTRIAFALFALATSTSVAAFAEEHPKSPRGQSATEVGGKWIEVNYGRPVLRGRQNFFGAGPTYGKEANGGAPVWRAGANETSRLKTEVPLRFGDKVVAPGSYDLFVELKDGAWTLVLSTQPALEVGGKKDKSKLWGAYGYDPKFDVVRVPMTLSKSEASIDQFTIAFVDITSKSGKLELAWEHTVATATFGIGG